MLGLHHYVCFCIQSNAIALRIRFERVFEWPIYIPSLFKNRPLAPITLLIVDAFIYATLMCAFKMHVFSKATRDRLSGLTAFVHFHNSMVCAACLSINLSINTENGSKHSVICSRMLNRRWCFSLSDYFRFVNVHMLWKPVGCTILYYDGPHFKQMCYISIYRAWHSLSQFQWVASDVFDSFK